MYKINTIKIIPTPIKKYLITELLSLVFSAQKAKFGNKITLKNNIKFRKDGFRRVSGSSFYR